ncbi:alpha/beta hydrolase [Gymnodinialimonas sp.]
MGTAPYPGLHPDLWDLARAMANDPNLVPEHLRPITDLRAAVAEMEDRLPPLPTDIQTHDWTLDVADRAVPLRTYTAPNPRAEAMLYIHGGGWSLGSLRGHEHVCADIARDTGLRVVSIDYALAPEHPYPRALTECRAAFEYLASGASPLGAIPALWLGGDSAGGNLALGTAATTQQAAGMFLIYPAVDPACRAQSYVIHAQAPYLTTELMHRCWRDYLQGQTPEPITFANLPRAVILTAALDPLLGDGEDLAATLLAASIPVWYEKAEGMIHGFIRWRDRSPAAAQVFARATRALAEAIERT